MERRKIVVLTITAFALIIVIGTIGYQAFCGPIVQPEVGGNRERIVIDTQGYPVIGNTNAKVELIVIEDFQCHTCAEFEEKLFPKILLNYIKTGLVRYTIIPLAFLPGSPPIANAALEVYAIAPDRFLPFIHAIFLRTTQGPIMESDLIQIAQLVGNIDLIRLQKCMDRGCHFEELNLNLKKMKALMGDDFGTPLLLVNGVPTSTASYHAIQTKIEEMLEKKP